MYDVLPYRGDYYPVLGQLLDEIDVAGTINKVINTPDTRSNIDVGTYTCLMILNLLGDVNIRLYRMNEFFEDKALPLMIPWNPYIDINEINDDRAGRVLDIIWNADPQKVFSAVSTNAIHIHELDTTIIHADTTSKSFEGAYEKQDINGIAPVIIQGFNKDHRPDLKQLIFGVGTTLDGIPIIGEVADGNVSDKKLNGRWVKDLRTILNKDIDDFLIYVADSSLVTTNNLILLNNYNVDFISRLPGTFDIEKKLKEKALVENNWECIGKLSDEKDSAIYQSWSTFDEIEGIRYRFVVISSDHKDERKLKSLDKTIKKESTEIYKKLKELSKRQFICKRDAEIESEKFSKKYRVKYHQITWEIQEKIEKVKRNTRGRPNKNEILQTQTKYYLSGHLRINKELYENECGLCGLFILITSLKDEKKYSTETILKMYKGQGNVERIFKFIKNPAWIGAFCLKKQERLAALGYVLLIAAMVYTLWERRVRKVLASDNVLPIDGLNKIKTKKPTTYALQTILSSILVLCQKVDNRLCIWLPKPLKQNQKRVLELTGLGEEIYNFREEQKNMKKNHSSASRGCEM